MSSIYLDSPRSYTSSPPPSRSNSLEYKVTVIALTAIAAFASIVTLPSPLGFVAAAGFIALGSLLLSDDEAPPRKRGHIHSSSCRHTPPPILFSQPLRHPNPIITEALGEYGRRSNTSSRAPVILAQDCKTVDHRQAVGVPSGTHVMPRGRDTSPPASKFDVWGVPRDLLTRAPVQIATDSQTTEHRRATETASGTHVMPRGRNSSAERRGVPVPPQSRPSTSENNVSFVPMVTRTRNDIPVRRDTQTEEHKEATGAASGTHAEPRRRG
jgi:hypothetical protein